MGKKANLDQYFDKFKKQELPTTTKKIEPAQDIEQHRAFTEHNIFDDPSDIDISPDTAHTTEILSVDPNDIVLWKYKDRPENELGDLEEFARVLKSIGQLQPGIVRLSDKPGPKYELLVGERRWRACKIAGIKFQVKVTNYTNTQAGLAQAIENKKRETLSDYASGINYARQIEDGILTQSDLVRELGTSRQFISKLLSYREIPHELIEAIGDMTKVSPNTAEVIKTICKRDSEGLSILLGIADKIRSGIGHVTLNKYYADLKEPPKDTVINSKVTSRDGRHLFTWRKDGNGNLSISFPKDIRSILDIKAAEHAFKESIEQQIKLSLQRDKKE